MSAFKKLPISKIVAGAACVLLSLSLTVYVDLFALDSVGPRLLAFVGFLLASGTLVWLAGRFFKSFPSLKAVLLSTIAAAFLLLINWKIFFPLSQETFISLICETAGEICLCDVVVDGINIPVRDVEVTENSGWLYRGQYDNFMIYPEEDGVENRLTLRFVAEEVHLGFPLTPYAGSVTLEDSHGGSERWYLRCPEWEEGEAVQYVDCPFDCRYSYPLRELIVCAAGLLAVLTVLCLVPIYVTVLIGEKFYPRLSEPAQERQSLNLRPWLSRGKRLLRAFFSLSLSERGPVAFIIFLAAYCLFSFIPSGGAPDKWKILSLSLFTVAAYLLPASDSARRYLEKYKSRGKRALIAAIALYASFACFGQRFFLNGNTRMHVSDTGLFYLLLGTGWFILVIHLLLLALELMASRPLKTEVRGRRRAFWALLALMCLCQAVILISFWPGGFATDSLDLLKQAIGAWSITDWHPAINGILYRLILMVFPRAGSLIALQLFFFALLCTKFLMLGYDHGVSFKTLAILGTVFSLLPNQVIFGTTPLKDYSYTLSLLWGTYLLVRLALDPKELKRWQFLLSLPLSMFFIYAFRHNGIVPFIAMLMLFAFITWKHFSRVKLRLAAASLASILLIAVYKGPVFSFFEVSQELKMSPYTTMLCAVASCINKGLPLSEESTAIMESVLPLDQWAAYYDRYLGHDPYYWGRGELANAYPFEPTKITARQAFTAYLEALRKYPDVVIKDRVDGMDILWDVCQPADSFNKKGFYDIVIAEGDNVSDYFDFGPMEPGITYYNHSLISKIYRKTTETPINSIFDMLLWRSGAYLILLMVLGLFWWGNRMKSLLWAVVPLVGQVAGLVLVLYHQSYRYIAAVQILTLALVFCSIFLCHAQADGSPWEAGEREKKEAGVAEGTEERNSGGTNIRMALFSQSLLLVSSIKMEASNMKIFHSLLPKLAPSTLWKGAACVVSSLALTAYVDLFTLNSLWTRLLLFVCVLAACASFTYGASCFFKSAPSFKMVQEAIAAAALTLIVCQRILFPTIQEVFITLIAETAGEICLCDLVIDGENCPIADAEVIDNSGWLYREQYDNFVIWPEKDGTDNHLTMRFSADEVHFSFPYTPYAGTVTIRSSTGAVETLDLRCPEREEGEAVQYADVSIDFRRISSSMARLGYNAGFLLILSVLFLTACYAVGMIREKLVKTARSRYRRFSTKILPGVMDRFPIATKISGWRMRGKTQAHYERWIAGTLALTTVMLLAFASVTAYIDPLFHYHGPLPNYVYPLDDERYQNDGITRNFEYDGIITGTSMTQNFKTSEAEALFGVPFIKVPFSAGYFKEIDGNLRRGFAVKNIDYVIRALDYDMIYKHKDAVAYDVLPNYLYNNNPFDDVNYVLNKSIFFDWTQRVLKNTAAGCKSTTFDEYANWNSGFTFGAEAVLATYSLVAAADSPRAVLEEERQMILENIQQNVTDLVDKHPETDFYLFFAPYSICFWDMWQENKAIDFWIDIEQIAIEELLKYPNIKLYCFYTNFDMICDLNNYKDHIHYGEWVNSWMLEQMYDGNYLLTKDNYLEHLEAMREFYNSYDYASLHN